MTRRRAIYGGCCTVIIFMGACLSEDKLAFEDWQQKFVEGRNTPATLFFGNELLNSRRRAAPTPTWMAVIGAEAPYF